jgi:hypothetical protein
MRHQQRGYILLITFAILALCTALVSMFMVKGLTHKKLTSAFLEQEKMNQFVLSTPALAQSFLSFSLDDMKLAEKVAGGPADKSSPVSGGGDFGINGLYDLVNKKFYDEGVTGKDQKVFATWLFEKIAKITEKPSLLQPFIEHVKHRKVPFNDVTELLAIKEFATCFSQTVFYEPEQPNTSPDKKIQKLFLTDIFTVASESDTIQPWLLSPSVCVLLDIAQKGSKHEASEKKEETKVDLSSFKQQADWQKDWDVGLKPLYDVSFDKIPEPVRSMLSTQFSVTVFSMLATVAKEAVEGENNMTVRIFAILKQKKLPDSSIIYDVIKIYQV